MLNQLKVVAAYLLSWSAVALSSFGAPAVVTPVVAAPVLVQVQAEDPSRQISPTYSLPLKWSDRATSVLTVPIKNDWDTPMVILGTQATGGVFVSDAPTLLPAKSSDVISFVYSAPDNSDSDLEILRVLTDQGIKEVHLQIARDKVVSVDKSQLVWSTGAKADTQVVTLTVSPGTVKPYRVNTFGKSQAALQKVNDTTWTISVTPISTAQSGSFPVTVDFDLSLPGRSVVVVCSVKPTA